MTRRTRALERYLRGHDPLRTGRPVPVPRPAKQAESGPAVDHYLRARDPLLTADPALAAQLGAGTAALPLAPGERAPARPRHAPARATRRIPRVALPRPLIGVPVAATVAVAIIVVLAVLPSNRSELLSPQAAVAAVSGDLAESNAVLEWSDVQYGIRQDPERQGVYIRRWVDLRTGDYSESQELRFSRRNVPGTPDMSLWQVGGSRWTREGGRTADGKAIVDRDISPPPRRAALLANTPIVGLRRTLDRARQGRLAIRDGGRPGGIPIVIVTRRVGLVPAPVTEELWISRELMPRLLRTISVEPCGAIPASVAPSGRRVVIDCSKVSDDGTRRGASTSVARTLVWKLHPRTSEWLAKVRPPRFDPATTVVITKDRSR